MTNIMTRMGRVEQANLASPAQLAEIDGWLAGRADSTPFHRPAWIKAVAQGSRQEARMLLARDDAGALTGLLPLNLIHSPLFGRALVSSGFAVDGGILADDPSVVQALADKAVELAGSWSCPTLELRGGAAPEGSGWITKGDAYLGFRSDVAPDEETQLTQIPRKHRAEVRKGIANEFQVRIGSDEALRAAHYALYCRSVHNLGTPVFPRAIFDAVLDHFGEAAEIALVFDHDGAPLSSILSLIHGGAYMPYWQGADRNARAARSNELVYFKAMSRARELGLKTFDFGRSKVETGPAKWKKSWGFEGAPLSYYIHAQPGHEPRDINPLSPQYRRKIELWKALPNRVADMAGPWIARGLG